MEYIKKKSIGRSLQKAQSGPALYILNWMNHKMISMILFIKSDAALNLSSDTANDLTL